MRTRICMLLCLCSLALAGCGQGKPTDDLIADLNSNEDVDRISAVRFLQNRRGDPSKVVPALTESLKDHDADVRWGAAIGLAYFGPQAKSALDALEELQSDKDARVRNAAKTAISRIKG